ncbi:hypothetical protein [Phocaeicola sp.]|uniref:hypothetical protein n=1 Tax=Phocaeicola sp. TaxID=2773926 RepID=UPI00307B412F
MGTDGDICGHFSKRAFFLLLFAADFKIESWVERQKSAFEAGLEKRLEARFQDSRIAGFQGRMKARKQDGKKTIFPDGCKARWLDRWKESVDAR